MGAVAALAALPPDDAGAWLVGPFKDFFSLDDRKLEVAVNWGIALLVYVVVGRTVAGFLRRARP